MEESLSRRFAAASGWAFTLRISDRVLSLGRTILLARLLAPRDFGLFGIALLTLSTLEAVTQGGLAAAIVQRKGSVRAHLDTAWTLQLARGAILAAIVFLGAPLAAGFFLEPLAIPLLRTVALSVLLQAFSNVGAVLLQRELDFRRRFFHLASGTVADLVVSVLFAFVFRSAWALVFGLLARNATQTVVSYIVHSHRPRLSFSRARATELLEFGRWVFLSGLIAFLITQGDDILVGRVLGATALGLYQMAYRLANLSTTEVSHVISAVAFPAYAEIQQESSRLSRGHRDLLGAVALLAFPMAVGVIFLAPAFVSVVLGQDWIPAVPAVQILAAYGALRALGSTNGALLSGSGNPRVDLQIGAWKLLLLGILIYPMTIRWGIAGTALATTVPSFLTQWLGFRKVAAILECRARDLCRPLVLPLAGSFTMAAVLALVRASTSTPLLVLVVGTVVGGTSYAISVWGLRGRWPGLDPLGPVLARFEGRRT